MHGHLSNVGILERTLSSFESETIFSSCWQFSFQDYQYFVFFYYIFIQEFCSNISIQIPIIMFEIRWENYQIFSLIQLYSPKNSKYNVYFHSWENNVSISMKTIKITTDWIFFFILDIYFWNSCKNIMKK